MNLMCVCVCMCVRVCVCVLGFICVCTCDCMGILCVPMCLGTCDYGVCVHVCVCVCSCSVVIIVMHYNFVPCLCCVGIRVQLYKQQSGQSRHLFIR